MKKNIQIYLSILMNIIAISSFSQNWYWSKQIGRDKNVNHDLSVDRVVSGNGNIYVAGRYYASYCHFDNDSLPCVGYNDCFVVKYNSSGVEQWARRFGGYNTSNQGEICQIAFDSVNSYLYVAGCFYDTCNFGSINLISVGSSDIFIAKYDVNGNCIWAKQAGGGGDDVAEDLAVNEDGFLYITGINLSSATFDTTTISQGVFVAKYDDSGNCLWAKKKFNTASTIWGTEIGPTSLKIYNNDLFIGGPCFVDNLSVDTITISNANSQSIVLVRFDSAGNAKWMIAGGGPYEDNYFDLLAVDHNGNSYMTGIFGTYAIFNTDTIYNSNNAGDFFLAKYDSSGHYQWVTQGYHVGGGYGAQSEGLAIDNDSGVYITGFFSGTVHFGSQTITASSPYEDMFIAKYNDAADCIGVIDISNPTGGLDGYKICTDNNNNIISAGLFQDTMAFGSNWPMISYNYNYDIFVVKTDAITGIEEEGRFANNQLIIYANPTAGTCNVTIPDEFKNERNLTLQILDNNGKLLQQMPVQMGEGKVRLNMEEEAKGVYNVVLSNGKKSYQGRVVFE